MRGRLGGVEFRGKGCEWQEEFQAGSFREGGYAWGPIKWARRSGGIPGEERHVGKGRKAG